MLEDLHMDLLEKHHHDNMHFMASMLARVSPTCLSECTGSVFLLLFFCSSLSRCFYNHSMHPVAFVSFALYFCRIDVKKTFPQALSAAVASSSDSVGFCHIESFCDGDTLLQQRRPSGFRAG